MEAYARAPDPLTNDGDMASNWQSWKEDFIIFMKVTGYINHPDEVRANLLKNRIGKVGIEAIQNISFNNIQDKDNMDILIEKLEEYFNPPKKEVVERYNFFTRSKKQNESIEQYINILKEKAKTCNFNDMTDSIIRDKIILVTSDKILRKKFFEAENLDLPKLVAIYNDYNINTEKMKQVTKENRAEPTHFIPKPPEPTYFIPKPPEPTHFIPKPPDNREEKKKGCWRCHQQHPLGKCPAWGSKCTKCGDINHFTHCCRGTKIKTNDKMNKNLLQQANLTNPMQQAKLTPKNNAKWNNQADCKVETTDSMNKTIFPDIPTTKLCYDNTTNYSAHLPQNTQYDYSYTKEIKSDKTVTPDLYNKSENIPFKPRQMEIPSTSQAMSHPNGSLRINQKEHRIHILRGTPTKFTDNRKKKQNDSCTLS